MNARVSQCLGNVLQRASRVSIFPNICGAHTLARRTRPESFFLPLTLRTDASWATENIRDTLLSSGRKLSSTGPPQITTCYTWLALACAECITDVIDTGVKSFVGGGGADSTHCCSSDSSIINAGEKHDAFKSSDL